VERITQGVVEAGEHFDEPIEHCRRIGMTPERGEHVTKIVQGNRMIRAQREGALAVASGLLEPAQILERSAAVAQRVGVLGIQRQRPVVAIHGIRRPAQIAQCVAAIAKGVGAVRFQPQRFVVTRERVLRPAQIAQCVAAVQVSGITRLLNCDRPIVSRQGFGRLLQPQQYVAEVDPGRGVSRLDLHRSSQQVRGRRELAGLRLEQTEELQRICMRGSACEDFPIERRRPRDIAELVLAHRLLKVGIGVSS
jgi:hypothetical protein